MTTPLLIRLCAELDFLPNFEWLPQNICDGCGMPTGDAYFSGHLVPSLWDLHMFYLLRPILFRTCRYFTGLCSSNIPRYFLDFTQRTNSFVTKAQNYTCIIETNVCICVFLSKHFTNRLRLWISIFLQYKISLRICLMWWIVIFCVVNAIYTSWFRQI